jgi:hypothetical protein
MQHASSGVLLENQYIRKNRLLALRREPLAAERERTI